jgi:uncharacterized protein
MSHMRAALSLLILALSPLTLSAQSFDCKLAQTPREKIVCSDTRLSALDAEIAANFNSLRAQLSPESAALVLADQGEWLRWIDLVCPANGKGVAANQTQCLQREYFTRANDLAQDKVTHLGSTVIFVRSHFLYKPGTAATTNPISPGFGYGSLRWPQIDRPNATQIAWNNAIKTKAERLPVDLFAEKSSTPKDATFDTYLNAGGSIDAYYTVEAANDRFIAVTFTDGILNWGAAHPNSDDASFLWWLDRNRELKSEDVFLPDSGWQAKVATLAIASLRSQADIKIYLYSDIDRPVKDTVSNPTSWTPTRNGLTITFAQYAIGASVLGMPQAHLTWSQLTPYLAPTLNPATLPAPVPRPKY